MRAPVTYTAAVENGTVSVQFSRKPRLAVRENIHNAGLRWMADSRAWTGKPEDPAALLAMLRDTLGSPASVTLDLTAADPEPETESETEPAPAELPADPEPTPEPEPTAEPEEETNPEPATAAPPTLAEAETVYHAYADRLLDTREQLRALRDEIDAVYDKYLLDANGHRTPLGMLSEEQQTAFAEVLEPLRSRQADTELEIDRLERCHAYASDNLNKAREDYYLPIAAEVVKRFAGKPAGEKTAAELSSALSAAADCDAHFYRRDSGYHSHHYGASIAFNLANDAWIHVYPDCIDHDTGRVKAFEHKPYANYVNDIEATADASEELKRQAREAMESLRILCDRYNATLPSSARSDRLYPRFS